MAGAAALESRVLAYLATREGDWTGTLEIAKAVKKQTKKDVNPTLYMLQAQGRLEKDGDVKPRWRLSASAGLLAPKAVPEWKGKGKAARDGGGGYHGVEAVKRCREDVGEAKITPAPARPSKTQSSSQGKGGGDLGVEAVKRCREDVGEAKVTPAPARPSKTQSSSQGGSGRCASLGIDKAQAEDAGATALKEAASAKEHALRIKEMCIGEAGEEDEEDPLINYKGLLQELFGQWTIAYEMQKENPCKAEVQLPKHSFVGRGCCLTKQASQQSAAKVALEFFSEHPEEAPRVAKEDYKNALRRLNRPVSFTTEMSDEGGYSCIVRVDGKEYQGPNGRKKTDAENLSAKVALEGLGKLSVPKQPQSEDGSPTLSEAIEVLDVSDPTPPEQAEKDYKSELNVALPAVKIVYTTVAAGAGFKSVVSFQGESIEGQRIGQRKIDAEKFAAKEALEFLASSNSHRRRKEPKEPPNPRGMLSEQMQQERRLAIDLQLQEHDLLLEKMRDVDLQIHESERVNFSACIKSAARLGVIDALETKRLQEINSRGNCAKHTPERLQPVLTLQTGESASPATGAQTGGSTSPACDVQTGASMSQASDAVETPPCATYDNALIREYEHSVSKFLAGEFEHDDEEDW